MASNHYYELVICITVIDFLRDMIQEKVFLILFAVIIIPKTDIQLLFTER